MPEAMAAKTEQKQRSPFIGALAGILAGALCGLFGFFFATMPVARHLGWVLFLLVPIAAGIAIVFTTSGKGSLIAAALLSTLVTLFVLIAAGKEGLLCALMAFPFIFVSLLAGIAVGVVLRSFIVSLKAPSSPALLLLPLLIIGGHQLELKMQGQLRASMVKTTVWLPAAPEQVWPLVQRVDSIRGPKPFLMHVGLPIPQRCVLSGTAVDSKRTCYFDKGYIEETVLEWQPPYHMRLSVDRTNLPGRHWLGFENAEYTLQPNGGGTLLTRTTTITSGLSPSWYWEPLERWGVSSEHNYLFQDVERRVARR
jgi:Polyketide cyclase / dehydrase and lipid transport